MSISHSFGLKKKDADANSNSLNSIQQQKILEEQQQLQEELAERISDATSSVANFEAILPFKKTEAELKLEQEIESNSVDKLLQELEGATSTEEFLAIIARYDELLEKWQGNIALLRSSKHIKQYLAIVAVLKMVKEMSKQLEMLRGKQLTELLLNNLNTMQTVLAEQAQLMQLQNQQLQQKSLELSKQLSKSEQSLRSNFDRLRVDSAKLPPRELQVTAKQVQDSLRQMFAMKHNLLQGNNVQISENLKSMQQVQAQTQHIITSNILSFEPTKMLQVTKDNLQQIQTRAAEQIKTVAQNNKAIENINIKQTTTVNYNNQQQQVANNNNNNLNQHAKDTPTPPKETTSFRDNLLNNNIIDKQTAKSYQDSISQDLKSMGISSCTC